MLKKSSRKNQKGMAMMELIPIMIIIVILLNYSLGFFGAIHTGILNSMAARNYAFETFRHRSNLTYLRDFEGSETTQYSKYNMRWHASVSDKKNTDDFVATERRIDFFGKNEEKGTADIHNKQVGSVVDGKRFTGNDGVDPIWVRPQYGICLNSKCGKQN